MLFILADIFSVRHFDGFFISISIPLPSWYRIEIGSGNAMVQVAESPNTFEIVTQGQSSGGNYRFDRDNNFFYYVLIMKPLQL